MFDKHNPHLSSVRTQQRQLQSLRELQPNHLSLKKIKNVLYVTQDSKVRAAAVKIHEQMLSTLAAKDKINRALEVMDDRRNSTANLLGGQSVVRDKKQGGEGETGQGQGEGAGSVSQEPS